MELHDGVPADPVRTDPRSGGIPDGGIPDGGIPDDGAPSGSIPDADTPDGGAPDADTPDADTPDGHLPADAVPSGSGTPSEVRIRSTGPGPAGSPRRPGHRDPAAPAHHGERLAASSRYPLGTAHCPSHLRQVPEAGRVGHRVRNPPGPQATSRERKGVTPGYRGRDAAFRRERPLIRVNFGSYY
ncbi:hypothetical protein SVIO_071210 [Streptomyces violaceusniger]|uniref:Uncharacterized protein n=1 Tax=Streptomyces violaceusniger TaxID=68280 RepID=A0A4D4LDD2_STRVO|nr:hypothetical protein SVIO_071210 [Streptomyces violaceusniger]